MKRRPRLNRRTESIRAMIRETELRPDHLVYPLFIQQAEHGREPIPSMPGQFRHSASTLKREIESCLGLGLSRFVLFPKIEEEDKDRKASYSYAKRNFYLEYASEVKSTFPNICLISDVAMDPYSTDGHDGIVEDGRILNDESVEILTKMAVAQAEAGFDYIGPSDMMDGRVRAIREQLEANGYTDTGILSYTAKYASALYGPFRDALDSAPKSGDKRSYQMDPANIREAVREAALDEEEGADILMVKPAVHYLDVISALSSNSVLPIAAYHVSGEYAMLKAASEKGWLAYDQAMPEVLLSIRRAGADLILTYCARDYAEWWNDQE